MFKDQINTILSTPNEHRRLIWNCKGYCLRADLGQELEYKIACLQFVFKSSHCDKQLYCGSPARTRIYLFRNKFFNGCLTS